MYEFKSEAIKELRIKKGMSQRELGNRLGISDRAVSKWEKGLSQPTSANLILLSRIFAVPTEYFFTTQTPPPLDKPKGMPSLTELYKIGRGPSSSHTIGPEQACLEFKARNPDSDSFRVILYGSLAKTGKGHGTDVVITKTFHPIPCDIEFDHSGKQLPHPNTMDIIAFKNKSVSDTARVLSIGGGKILFEGDKVPDSALLYEHSGFSEISEHCTSKNIRLWQYALEREPDSFLEYMKNIWEAMKGSIQRGLNSEGILPGGLGVAKKAKSLFNSQHIDESAETRENRMVCAYAFAVSEQNASGEKIVTAPTCGASGVLPAVLYYQQQKHDFSDERIIQALISAGIIGNLIKTNASISGAECGCQAEIGSACAMAAAALAELFGLNLDKIEYAAEIAIEHHLGLTCDPICGLVQIPCIERNAVAAMRAINAVNLASFLWNTRKISFDHVVKTMKETGHDLSSSYKETSEAGLAKIRL